MSRPRNQNRRGLPPNLYQQPDGYFYYRNPQNGKTKGLGRDKAKAFQDARAANAHLAVTSKSSLVAWVAGIEQYTVEAWLDKYLPIWKTEEKPGEATVATAERYIKRIKKADFAHMLVEDVTTKHVADFLDGIEADSVALNLRTRLHDIFRLAETKGIIGTGKNPVSATKPRDYQVKRERLSLEQFLAIRAKVPKWTANAMNLALLTGQRRENIADFKFIDYKDGWLFFEQVKTGFKIQQDGRIRLDAIGMSIDEAIKACRDLVISKFMVHHTRSSGTYKAGAQVSADGITKAFATARDELKIVAGDGRTPPSFHEIRSLSERLYKQQYGAEFAQAVMGHKHAKMTAEYDDLRGAGWQVVQVK